VKKAQKSVKKGAKKHEKGAKKRGKGAKKREKGAKKRKKGAKKREKGAKKREKGAKKREKSAKKRKKGAPFVTAGCARDSHELEGHHHDRHLAQHLRLSYVSHISHINIPSRAYLKRKFSHTWLM
jgi:hypothetical protein